MVQCVEGYLDDGQVTGKLENEMSWWSKPKRRLDFAQKKIGSAKRGVPGSIGHRQAIGTLIMTGGLCDKTAN
jgi:hypothetical protein